MLVAFRSLVNIEHGIGIDGHYPPKQEADSKDRMRLRRIEMSVLLRIESVLQYEEHE